MVWAAQQWLSPHSMHWETSSCSFYKVGYFSHCSLVLRGLEGSWRASGLQSTLKAWRAWVLRPVKGYSSGGSSSRLEELVNDSKGKQAEATLLSLTCFYLGYHQEVSPSLRTGPPDINNLIKKNPLQVYPEACLLVDSRSVKLMTKVNHHRAP